MQSQLRSVPASLKTGRNLRSLRSEPLTTSDGRLMTDSQPTSSTQTGFCHMALKFKVTWTPHTNMIEEISKFWKIHPKDCFWFLWPKMSFDTCGNFLTLKFIAKDDLLYFLTSSDVRKGFPHISPAHLQFPHILHVWNWLQQISSHFSTVVRAGKSNEKFLTFFQCVEFRQTLFSLHQFHTCGKFLTFSSHFLTLKFHSECICRRKQIL